MPSFPVQLVDGYRHFRSGRFTDARERYRELARNGQSPRTMVIACCDSRAAPEMIFDTAPGEIFVIRNVANLVPPYSPDGDYHGTSAALEYAVQSLHVENIIVLGHGNCGGISAVLNPASAPLSPGDFIGKWMDMLQPAVNDIDHPDKDAPHHADGTCACCGCGAPVSRAARQRLLERVSIRRSLDNLRTFPCVSILESRGRLALHGAWFDIADGELWLLNSETDDFELVSGG